MSGRSTVAASYAQNSTHQGSHAHIRQPSPNNSQHEAHIGVIKQQSPTGITKTARSTRRPLSYDVQMRGPIPAVCEDDVRKRIGTYITTEVSDECKATEFLVGNDKNGRCTTGYDHSRSMYCQYSGKQSGTPGHLRHSGRLNEV